MAKRKRLTPPDRHTAPAKTAPVARDLAMPPFGETGTLPPIASVAGDAATAAALAEISGELEAARADGRLIQALPLEAIDESYLMRDRMGVDPEALEALTTSLSKRGQQTPIEVVAQPGGRYGLISGWRRLTALRQLRETTGDTRFATVLAVLRTPADASDAYLAMVEENEIRLGLSYYERARVVARSVDAGIFSDETAALRTLFATASRSKRSKIGAFLKVYRALDGAAQFPEAIPERLGLRLAKLFDDAPNVTRMRDRLRKAAPDTADAEMVLLAKGPDGAVAGGSKAPATPTVGSGSAKGGRPPKEVIPGVMAEVLEDGRLVLTGQGVTRVLQDQVIALIRKLPRQPPRR